MEDTMSIKDLMRVKQDMLRSNLSILLSHPVTKGEHCESAWIDFLRSFLPSKYAIDKGFVFDAHGNVSEQIDIIIYDALYTPLVFGTDAGEKIVTAESVYAVFDSKPKIDASTLSYTNKKIESVTRLHRSTRDVINGGVKQTARQLTKILGGILAIESVKQETLGNYLKVYKHIDLGCAVKNLAFSTKRDTNDELIDCYMSSSEETVISFFFLILDELYKLGTVAGVDIRDYADASLSSLKITREELEERK